MRPSSLQRNARRRSGRHLLVGVLLGSMFSASLLGLSAQEPPAKLEKILEGHDGPVYSVAYTPDGKTLVSGGHDKTVRVWNLATGRNVKTLQGFKGRVLRVAAVPPLKKGQSVFLLLAGTSDSADQVIGFDSKSWNRLIRLPAYGHGIHGLGVSRNGRILAVTGGNAEVTILDLTLGRKLGAIDALENSRAVAVSPDGKMVAYSSSENTFRSHDLAKGRPLNRFAGHTGEVTALAFSPDGKLLASGSNDTTLRIWDTARAEVIRTYKGHTGRLNSVAFTSNGKKVLTAGEDGHLFEWTVEGLEKPKPLKGHKKAVLWATCSPDGKSYASGGADGFVCVWRATD